MSALNNTAAQSSPTVQERWDAWRKPLVAHIMAMLETAKSQDDTNIKYHPLDRPNMNVHRSKGFVPDYSLELHTNSRCLFLEAKKTRGVYLSTSLSYQGNTALVMAVLDQPWDAQSTMTQECFSKFESMANLVELAAVALREGTPFGQNGSWKNALVEQLEEACNPANRSLIDWDHWEHWTAQWGTPDMQSALAVVNSLFDASKQKRICMESLLMGWSGHNLTLDANDISGDVFSP